MSTFLLLLIFALLLFCVYLCIKPSECTSCKNKETSKNIWDAIDRNQEDRKEDADEIE
jgi:hypothetical protein